MSGSIRIRGCLAVVEDARILLVPHFRTETGAVQWVIPGGEIRFGESATQTAVREFHEETGLIAEVVGLLTISEVILPEKPYHSITIAFSGKVVCGELRPEADHAFGDKIPRWFSAAEIKAVSYHPEHAVKAALGLRDMGPCLPGGYQKT